MARVTIEMSVELEVTEQEALKADAEVNVNEMPTVQAFMASVYQLPHVKSAGPRDIFLHEQLY